MKKGLEINIEIVHEVRSIVPDVTPCLEEVRVSAAFDLGMEHILRELAIREVAVARERGDIRSEVSDRIFTKLETENEDFRTRLPEKLRLAYRELQHQMLEDVGELEAETCDASFTAGFLAGYRFLKGIQR